MSNLELVVETEYKQFQVLELTISGFHPILYVGIKME